MSLTPLRRVYRRLFPAHHVSYAQCGEDLILRHLFYGYLGIENPTYLDIGAHHPTLMSNTFFFYKAGARGVCVEPDPTLLAEIKKQRPADTCLNVGVGNQESTLDFFVFDASYLNTFVKATAEAIARSGTPIRQTIRVPVLTPNAIMAKYFQPHPNFVSIDTEGMDLQILKAIDFAKFRPEVFCIETLDYTSQQKEKPIPDFMQSLGYIVYADTFLNTIFVDRNSWVNRKLYQGSTP
jgi:FkbM family methyltransferase